MGNSYGKACSKTGDGCVRHRNLNRQVLELDFSPSIPAGTEPSRQNRPRNGCWGLSLVTPFSPHPIGCLFPLKGASDERTKSRCTAPTILSFATSPTQYHLPKPRGRSDGSRSLLEAAPNASRSPGGLGGEDVRGVLEALTSRSMAPRVVQGAYDRVEAPAQERS